MKPYRIVIIGAGLAGLAAAYELAKHKQVAITVLEQRHRVGGRVHSLPIAGTMVDFGGFVIYPWYTEYHRLLKELRLEHTLEKIPLKNIYYQIDQSGKYYLEDTIPFPAKDTAWLTLKATAAIMQSRNIAEPGLDHFNRLTVAEYFRTILDRPNHAGIYETYANVLAQGYCYPNLEQFRMSFMAPFIAMTRLHGDVAAASFIPSGNQQLPNALAQSIIAAGHKISLGVHITTIKDIQADAIIFAQNVQADIYRTILPNTKIICAYTHYYTVTIRASAIPTIEHLTNWGAIFYLPNQTAIQIVSAINLHALYSGKLSGYINVNIVVRDAIAGHPWSKEKLFTTLQADLHVLFSNVTIHEITQLVYWPQTMPIVTEEFVEVVRQQQGKHGYYFAGDWLGAPSMETAITTGVRAAEHVLVDYKNRPTKSGAV